MKIGLMGFGVVGGGAYELIAGKYADIEVKRVLELRDIPEIRDRTVRDVNDILTDPEIAVAIEVLGGVEPAHTFAAAALRAGKHLVTANKLMLSLNYEELLRLARENGVSIAFSASVGGGIPWLVNLIRATRLDTIVSVGGIMNGTTNYILDAMTNLGADFNATLKEAQRMGYAEANPSADIDGIDVRSKIAISANVAFGIALDATAIPTFGIRSITSGDIARFFDLGLRCKLIGRAVRTEKGVCAYVEPALFSPEAPEYSVADTGNIISYVGERVGTQSFFGLGAGRNPTSFAVVQDIHDIFEGNSIFDLVKIDGVLPLDIDGEAHAYYLRTDAALPEWMPIERTLSKGVYLTGAIAVGTMHAAALKMKDSDPETFFAGL